MKIIGDMYGSVLSLSVKFSRSKKIKFVKFHVYGKKIRKIWKIEKMRGKNVEIMGEKLSDKNDPDIRNAKSVCRVA